MVTTCESTCCLLPSLASERIGQWKYSGIKEVITRMGLPLYCSILLLLCAMTAASSSDSSSNSFLPVSSGCGDIEIPYPFGVRGRAKSGFEVGCDGGSATLSLAGAAASSQLPIIDISLNGSVRVLAGSIAEHCDGGPSMSDTVMPSSSWIDLEGTPFTFSKEMNKLTVIGCDVLSMIRLSGSSRFTSGCMAFCESDRGGDDQSCSSMGCCQAAISRGQPQGGFTLKLRSITNATGDPAIASSPGNCSRAFLMQDDALTAPNYRKSGSAFPLVLDWVIGNETCAEASRLKNYACKAHTQCYDVLGVGYRCQCEPDFSGNPYLGCEGLNPTNPPSYCAS